MTKPQCWVTEAKQILPYVRETLNKLGFSHLNPRMDEWGEGINLGENICMHVEPEEKFKHWYKKQIKPYFFKNIPSEKIAGYTLRAQKTGDLEEIALREGTFCQVLNCAGHELGHILTPKVRDEEEKAYAFKWAWVRTTLKHNIVGYTKGQVMLAFSCSEPQNEPHRSAYQFVTKFMMDPDCDTLQLYWEIANKKVRNWAKIANNFTGGVL